MLADTSPMLAIPVACKKCGWSGTTIEAEGLGMDDTEGVVFCPKCAEWIEVLPVVQCELF